MNIMIITVLIFLSSYTFAQDENSTLRQLFDDVHEYNMRTYPEWATYEGDHRYNDKLTDNSASGIKARYDSTRMFLSRLLSLNYNDLTDDNKLNYDLFKHSLEEDLEGEKFNYHYIPLGQQGGIHINFPQLTNAQPFQTEEDFKNYFARLRGFKKSVNNVIEHMQSGLNAGVVAPVFIMEQVLQQINNIKETPVESSPFFTPVNTSKGLTQEERNRLSVELKEIIEVEIYPYYGQLYDFIEKEYLPRSRTEPGIWSLPGGEERYMFSVKSYTTTDLTPDMIFEIGMNEVARIRSEMEKVKNKTGFKGTLDEFNNYLKTDGQFYFTDKDDLMTGYRKILSEMDKKLPSLFGILPQAPYDLKEIEEFRAKSAPAAYYYSAPEDRSRPGYFYVNTYDLSSRPKYTMTALALHEAVPGHHLQIAIAQELKDLPRFRRNMGITAFVEGWGLYAESLGYEAGMYIDPYQKYGALIFEMWRAVRLVVDVGIHYKKWTREQAVEFMKSNTALSDLDVKSEVDRYISWPGQALAYKIGELKIKELRKRSEEKLGSRFDVREFHDVVLRNGAIPLPLLEAKVDEWINLKFN
jgi:uncharacterized protein (DUF885 family)